MKNSQAPINKRKICVSKHNRGSICKNFIKINKLTNAPKRYMDKGMENLR